MTLTAPAHLRVHDEYRKIADGLRPERRDWIIAQHIAGHSTRDISNALGVSISFAQNTLSQARRTGVLPPFVKPDPKPRGTAKPLAVSEVPAPAIKHRDPTTRVVICGSGRVTLPRMPGEDAESVLCAHRPESYPRFSLVRMNPTTERRTDVSGVIAAIRREVEKFAAASIRNDGA